MRTLTLITIAAGMISLGFGQTDKQKFMTKNEKSPPMQTSVNIKGKDIWISYHAPSARGRKIFGEDGLQKNGTIWRAGADQATFLHTDADLDINGLAVPAGEYTLFVDLDAGKWQLIVNKQIGQWGIKRDGSANLDDSKNVGKTAMTMSKPSSVVEQFKITLSDAGSGKGKLAMEWADVAASVPFTVK